jgi:uncharacterized DUF497 family protein
MGGNIPEHQSKTRLYLWIKDIALPPTQTLQPSPSKSSYLASTGVAAVTRTRRAGVVPRPQNVIGMSQLSKLLIVCHCYRESDTIIRIISARKPTKEEAQYYEEG